MFYIKDNESGVSTSLNDKILALTASAFEEDRQRVLAVGCDDFVRKPFREEMIWQKMVEHLGVRYVYAETVQPSVPHHQQSPVVDPHTLTADSLSMMSAEWFQQLQAAAIRGADYQLLTLLEQIPETHTPLAHTLKQWVDSFQFDKLLALAKLFVK